MLQIGRDLAFGTRLLRRARGLAAVSALVVALGIGTTTAIFSVVYGVMLRPLPYAAPDRLVALWSRVPNSANVDPGFRPTNVLSLHMAIPRSKYRTDQEIAAFYSRVVEHVAAVPGVGSAGMVNRLPPTSRIAVHLLSLSTADPPSGRAIASWLRREVQNVETISLARRLHRTNGNDWV
jgi:hypothetical protein